MRNAMAWDGLPGHYEVWYLTLADPSSGAAVWLRFTLEAPLDGPATCGVWLVAFDPEAREVAARRVTHPIDRLRAVEAPFRLTIADLHLGADTTAGRFEDVAWDLSWAPGRSYDHVHPLVRRGRLARTQLELPHGDVLVSGTLTLPGGRELAVSGAHATQAHLWGAEHAPRWAWAHAGDLYDDAGEPVPDSFVDGVSILSERLGRESGPFTAVVGRLLGEDFASTGPLRVVRNRSTFALTTWRFEAVSGRRRVIGEVDAPRDLLAGVMYRDPDGATLHCYNSGVATMRLTVSDRTGHGPTAWTQRQRLTCPARASFEYAQREPVPDVPLVIR